MANLHLRLPELWWPWLSSYTYLSTQLSSNLRTISFHNSQRLLAITYFTSWIRVPEREWQPLSVLYTRQPDTSISQTFRRSWGIASSVACGTRSFSGGSLPRRFSTQTGFMPRWDIMDNFYNTLNLIQCNKKHHKGPSLLLSLDMEKAFDQVEPDYFCWCIIWALEPTCCRLWKQFMPSQSHLSELTEY